MLSINLCTKQDSCVQKFRLKIFKLQLQLQADTSWGQVVDHAKQNLVDFN